jgi:hypothetical protein
MSSRTWEILDENGTLVGLHKRTDRAGGGKIMWWCHPDGRKSENSEVGGTDKLYNLELVKRYPGTKIVLVEGEPAADALSGVWTPEMDVLVLATVCGSSSTPTTQVLGHLAGREVLCWPDDDDSGRDHMQEVGALLAALGATVKLVKGVTWPIRRPTKDGGRKFGGDAADLVAQVGHLNGTQVGAIRNALEISPLEVPSGGGTEIQADGRPFKLTREETDPPVYLLHWPVLVDGQWVREVGRCVLRMTPATIQQPGAVITAWLTQQKRTPPWVPHPRRDPWTNTLTPLLDQMEAEDFLDPPPELTLRGRVLAHLVRRYGAEVPTDPDDPMASPDSLDRGEAWWELETGLIHFSLKSFQSDVWRNENPGDRLDRKQLKQAIEQLGGHVSERKDVVGGRVDRSRRRMTWLPWKVLLEADD